MVVRISPGIPPSPHDSRRFTFLNDRSSGESYGEPVFSGTEERNQNATTTMESSNKNTSKSPALSTNVFEQQLRYTSHLSGTPREENPLAGRLSSIWPFPSKPLPTGSPPLGTGVWEPIAGSPPDMTEVAQTETNQKQKGKRESFDMDTASLGEVLHLKRDSVTEAESTVYPKHNTNNEEILQSAPAAPTKLDKEEDSLGSMEKGTRYSEDSGVLPSTWGISESRGGERNLS